MKNHLWTLALFVAFVASVTFTHAQSVNKSFTGVAIKGYDPVAYFVQKKPSKGDKAHRFDWRGAKWHFSSAANLAAFKAAPEKYAPQYGGYCAWAMAQQWTVENGKLYLNYNADIQKKWTADKVRLITRADAAWKKRSVK